MQYTHNNLEEMRMEYEAYTHDLTDFLRKLGY